MIELKKDGKVIRMYSFETGKEMDYEAYWIIRKKLKVIFEGSKTELLAKDESFWNKLIKCRITLLGTVYPLFNKVDLYWLTCTAKESGHSALENCKEFIIITEERI